MAKVGTSEKPSLSPSNMVTIHARRNTHQSLLRDLSEITAVLDVESQLIRALVAMAIERQVQNAFT